MCKICKKRIEKDTAYKIESVVNKKNGEKGLKRTYFCSEAEWQAEENRKKKYQEDKDRVYYFICDMFGYEIQNTQLFDEWACWNKLKSNEVIYKYLRDNESYLRQICDKAFDNEYQKIRYFSAILKNSLRDYVPKVEVAERPKVIVGVFELFEPTIAKPQIVEEQVLYDVEDDLL